MMLLEGAADLQIGSARPSSDCTNDPVSCLVHPRRDIYCQKRISCTLVRIAAWTAHFDLQRRPFIVA